MAKTTSIRRTARLTGAAEAPKLPSAPVAATKSTKRGYVAVKFTGVDSRTEMMHCTANKDLTIQGEHGASVALKAGEKFTAVRAGSLGPDMWYIVRNAKGEKKCTCAANKPCKHEIKVASGKSQTRMVTGKVSAKVAEAKRLASSGEIVNETAAKFASADAPAQSVEQAMARVAADLGALGTLNGQPQTPEMPAWLAILPSRREMAIA